MGRLLLSCDGGGIRGLATCQFLLRLEEAVGKPIHELFDMFAGTSVGAILVGCVAVKELTVQEAMNMYDKETVRKIFNASLLDKSVGVFQTDPKYDGVGKYKFFVYCGVIK